jgi:SAM-dependent methyltransferase
LPGYATRKLSLSVGGDEFRLRVLDDLQQFSDPDGHAASVGISCAQWSLFGRVWPAARLLAEAMLVVDIDGKRILELGCGIGLASLVLQRRGADVIASDIHPLAEAFLAYNSALNALPLVHFRRLSWEVPLPTLGHFDLIIGSDILYQADHAELLAGVVERHALGCAQVVISDPGRGNVNRFGRAMAALGFQGIQSRHAMEGDEPASSRGRLLRYNRSATAGEIAHA